MGSRLSARDIKIGRYETDFPTPNSNDATHVRIDVSFNSGGANYFSGGYERKGYQVTFNPVAIDGGCESCIVGDRRGMRVFVVAAPRFDARRLTAVADLIEPHAEVLALLVALANGDANRLHALGELVRRIVAGSVTDEDKRTMQAAHAQADPSCTCNDCIVDAMRATDDALNNGIVPPTDEAAIANEVVAWIADTGVGADPLLIFCRREACVETAEKQCKAGVSPQAVTRAEAEASAENNRETIFCERCEDIIAAPAISDEERADGPTRERGDDDGREYADPRDEIERRLLID